MKQTSPFKIIKNKSQLMIINSAHDTLALREFLLSIDTAFADPALGKLHKDDSNTLKQFKIGDLEIMAKRNNIKGFWQGCKRAFTQSKAMKNWLNALSLAEHDIATPEPIAVVETRLGPIHRHSYYLCRYQPGVNAHFFFHDKTQSKENLALVAEKIATMIKRLHGLGISHGDTKAPNFIISDNKPWLIDLDAMGTCHCPRKLAKAKDKDIERFLRWWRDDEELLALFRGVFAPK